MILFVLRRLLSTIPVMLTVALIVFSILYFSPGDPAALIAGETASAEDVARVRDALGLDEPFLIRFWQWLWAVLHFDVAALAMDEFLVWVKADSPYQSVTDLIDAAKAAPGKIPFGGSQSKDTDETLVALIEQTSGADFKYVPFNGGGEVGVQLAGGHVTANVNNPNENLGQWQAGAVRPICVFAPKRMAESAAIHDGKGWHDIPTCKEQGLNIESYQMPRTVWVPKDVPAEAVAFYADTLKSVSQSPEWQEYLTKTSQSGAYLTGDELKSFIANSETKTVEVFKSQGWSAE